MAMSLQSPELDAWASGFPVMLLHGAVTLAIFAGAAALLVGAKLAVAAILAAAVSG